MSFACHLHVVCMPSYFFYMYSYVIRMSVVCPLMSSVCHSYVLVCHPCVTHMYSYVTRMSLVCTRMSSVCHSYVIPMSLVCTRMSSVYHSYVLVCHPYVTRMYWYVIRMSLVCTRMSFVCHSYVVLPWTVAARIFLFKMDWLVSVADFSFENNLFYKAIVPYWTHVKHVLYSNGLFEKCMFFTSWVTGRSVCFLQKCAWNVLVFKENLVKINNTGCIHMFSNWYALFPFLLVSFFCLKSKNLLFSF